jgi:hypothetical protein
MTKNVFLLWYIADHEVTKKVQTLTINEFFSPDKYSISFVTYFRETISILKIENFDHNCYLAFIAKEQGNDLWLTMIT